MFKIENNKMSITRGDDAEFTVTLENPDGTPYSMEQGDILTFTVKTSMSIYVNTSSYGLFPNQDYEFFIVYSS